MTGMESPSSGGCLKPLIAISCSLPIHVVVGTIFGQSAGMLPQLMKEDSIIQITRDEATWIASIPVIGTCISSCIGGRLSDMYGRVRMCQACYFLCAIGYAVMVGAESVMMLLLGRFLIGLGCGLSFPALVYASEWAPPAYRGLFLSFCPLLASTGLVYMYIVGGYLPWNMAAASTCLMSIIGLFLAFLSHDPPQWLVQNNKIEEARKSLKRVEHPANVEAKLMELQETAQNQSDGKAFNIRTFSEPTVWKPFLMILALSFLQNVCGFYIVIYYTVQFMAEFHSTYDPLQITVAVGTVRLFAMLLSSYLLRRMGRKTIGAISGFGSAATLFFIFAYLYFEKSFSFLSENSWIPIGLFLAFIVAMTLGIFPLPWTVPYEVFPIKVRGVMCGASFGSMYLIMFFAVKLYNTLIDNLGLKGMILMFAMSSLLFAIFCNTLLVETHRKTLDEIEQEFSKKPQQT